MSTPPDSLAYTEDRLIWPIMLDLVDCLRSEIEAAGVPGVCFLGVLPGAQWAADWSDEGQAWVRLVAAFPSATLPSPDQRATCAAPLAAVLEVGMLRCAPVGDGPEPPSEVEMFEATRLQMADMRVMLRAIQCCLGKTKREHVLGLYTPLGPQGAAVGGSWQVTVSQRKF